jgi:hypothetical protein
MELAKDRSAWVYLNAGNHKKNSDVFAITVFMTHKNHDGSSAALTVAFENLDMLS